MENIFNIKSECNFKCAEWAYSQQYFDVAVSRLYYSLFLKCTKIVKDFNYKPPCDPNRKKGSHEKMICDMISLVDRVLYYDEEARRGIKKLNAMKRYRVIADYKPQETKVEQYSNTILPSYYEVMSAIEKLEGLQEGYSNGC